MSTKTVLLDLSHKLCGNPSWSGRFSSYMADIPAQLQCEQSIQSAFRAIEDFDGQLLTPHGLQAFADILNDFPSWQGSLRPIALKKLQAELIVKFTSMSELAAGDDVPLDSIERLSNLLVSAADVFPLDASISNTEEAVKKLLDMRKERDLLAQLVAWASSVQEMEDLQSVVVKMSELLEAQWQFPNNVPEDDVSKEKTQCAAMKVADLLAEASAKDYKDYDDDFDKVHAGFKYLADMLQDTKLMQMAEVFQVSAELCKSISAIGEKPTLAVLHQVRQTAVSWEKSLSEVQPSLKPDEMELWLTNGQKLLESSKANLQGKTELMVNVARTDVSRAAAQLTKALKVTKGWQEAVAECKSLASALTEAKKSILKVNPMACEKICSGLTEGVSVR
eukprot:6492140-Amphidinium_carterae.3